MAKNSEQSIPEQRPVNTPSDINEEEPEVRGCNEDISTSPETQPERPPSQAKDAKDDDDDDDGNDEPSPMLKIMIEKHEAIEKTVSMIKKEISTKEHQGAQGGHSESNKVQAKSQEIKTIASDKAAKPVKEEFDQLNSLLADNKVQSMIREVGHDTQSVIDRALRAINSSKSLEDKRTAFSLGLQKLQLNLETKKNVDRDPNYSMAMNLVGLNSGRSRRN